MSSGKLLYKFVVLTGLFYNVPGCLAIFFIFINLVLHSLQGKCCYPHLVGRALRFRAVDLPALLRQLRQS